MPKFPVMNLPLSEYCAAKLAETEAAGLLRQLREWEGRDTRVIRFEGRELLNFASNDYLGLAAHPEMRAAMSAVAGSMTGATASRLITGNHPAYAVLEAEIARLKNAEAALVFTSGYAAATGTIPALVGKDDFIVMDKLCHASLVDGARLSGATLRVFPHNNLKRCAELLARCCADGERPGCDAPRTLLITESVFSMDGDLAPLDDLAELKQRHGAWLMVDEAHATGVFGANGRGGAEQFGVEKEVDVSMGTLSKALGCLGGFICGSRALREWLVNRARSLIYSTGLPPAVCLAGVAAIRLLREEPGLRRRLWHNLKLVKEQLNAPVHSPIVPILIGDERRCVALAEMLREEGVMTPAVRYPTVGRGKARLRVSISAAHTEEDILRLTGILGAHHAGLRNVNG